MSELYSSVLNHDAIYSGRTISKESFDKAIQEYMKRKYRFVYLDPYKRSNQFPYKHNDELTLDKVVGEVKDIDLENYKIDVELTDNPSGKLIKSLIEEKHNVSFSCRFIGRDINEKDEYENVRLEDIVVLDKYYE